MQEELDNTIDFDKAQKEWRKNKVCGQNGTFKYICGLTTRTGKICRETGRKHKIFHHKKYNLIYDEIFNI
jgi:hypothetical protein